MRPPHLALRIASAISDARFYRAHRDAARVQRRLWRRLVGLYRGTELGRALGLPRFESPEAYARGFRATGPADYRALWERARAENPPNLVHPRRLRYMSGSSGTLEAARYIPVPEELLRAYRRFTTQGMFHAFRALGDYTLLDGTVLVTAASPALEETASGITIGASSGLATRKASRLARQVFRPTPDILEIAGWQEKIERTVAQAIDLDVRALTGLPICVVPLLEHLLEVARARGRPASSARAVWPNLRVYLFSGSPLALHGDKLRRLLGEGVETFEAYSSTEAPFAFQHRAGAPDLVCALDTCYFELAPAGADDDHPRVPLHEAKVGRTYRILPTTPGGLFAYSIGDLVEVTGREPYLVRFAGREREEVKIGSGHVTAADVTAVIAAAAAETGAAVEQFFVCPAAGEATALEWCVELERPPADAEAFRGALDRLLAERNRHVALARRDAILLPPRLTVLPRGTVDAFVRARRQFGQGKFLHLYGTRELPEEVLALAERPG
jgi:hypothetical protein